MSGELDLPLFPHWARRLGLFLMVLGLPCGILYFLGRRPPLLNVPVFALVSSYAEARFLAVVRTNLLDEAFAVLCMGGAALIAFSREAIETPVTQRLRLRALLLAGRWCLVAWLLACLLVYGWVIVIAAVALFPAFLLGSYACFRWLVWREARANAPRERERARVDHDQRSSAPL